MSFFSQKNVIWASRLPTKIRFRNSVYLQMGFWWAGSVISRPPFWKKCSTKIIFPGSIMNNCRWNLFML